MVRYMQQMADVKLMQEEETGRFWCRSEHLIDVDMYRHRDRHRGRDGDRDRQRERDTGRVVEI